jgi:2-polyprenyl-3-methyl-5-hydroxy-6-metoxy-1,4-benzoquinol methylase
MNTAVDVKSHLVDVRCDCCGHSDEELLFEKPGALTGYPFRIVRCRRCRFVYVNPRLDEEATARLYDSEYYKGEGFDPHVQYEQEYGAANETNSQVVAAMTAYKQPPARVLDFGCGLGDLLRQTAARGYHADGFEVSEYGRTFARKNGSTVFASHDEIPSDTYDIVIAVEVVEHLFRPSLAFATIRRVLRTGGVFLYTTYNIDRFLVMFRLGLAKDHGYIVPEGHINFFSHSTARRFFENAGFGGLAPSLELGTRTLKRKAKLRLKRLVRLDLPGARK